MLLRFQTSDPDIATIYRRISRAVIDLQPNFQRGEVWSTPKKQRLIDTILRQWHVPPIHLVAKGDGKFDVLDGQQRLTAIRDFMRGDFPVDGTVEPSLDFIQNLDGLRFGQLPQGVQDEFEAFAIRVFELRDFTPDEPHELFFRLNQPVALTEAEKRNAFIGPARNQVKDLVAWAESQGMTQQRLGFSNARMAYDDLLSRFLVTLEQRGFTEKITSARVAARYRERRAFDQAVIERAKQALAFFLKISVLEGQNKIRPNKATIHTWLCIASKLAGEGLLDELQEPLVQTILVVERWRATREASSSMPNDVPLAIFHDRATARVADVSSVILRDCCAWMVFYAIRKDHPFLGFLVGQLEDAWTDLNEVSDPERALVGLASRMNWGAPGWL
ncbi:DUF262 domain-containing protein [Micromonospora sp. NBC_01638]|uniref:DUF262 domain-containing protein n=1 Tax=Micromonospora sp. NBC_01638 TaxID=2975982 RepID=UPI0038699EAE|nr:DUF262 domain-containing protein [Micromonospora sp. NBC_01638]